MKKETKEKFLEFCKKEHFNISNETSKQREAVFSDEKYVIPAGAGSGKTTVLTYRFLRLIMDEDIGPIHSDEILTMTFTKAATANMKSRIYKALKVAESNGLIDKEEIDRFSNAEICTTDSFCSKIVRLDSIRYGISPDFGIE
ncbi:MAG: UvrD-helicase domain-containing protein, partial [Candidatus Ornithospirochaeta sp.]